MYKAKSGDRTNEWGTPTQLFRNLDWEFGGFTLDACASRGNHKVSRYFTKEDNALEQRWSGRVWINPPFEKGGLDKWVDKIIKEVNEGNVELVVALLPTYNALATHLCMEHASEIKTVRYHLRFHDTRNGVDHGPFDHPAPFNTMIAVFRNPKTVPQVHTLINELGLPVSRDEVKSGERRVQSSKRSADEDSDEDEGSDETYYPAERLLDNEKRGRQMWYLVQWEGCPLEEASWEPKSNLTKLLLQEYEKSQKRLRHA
jgi:phage N-6-adenine-methyltransferase